MSVRNSSVSVNWWAKYAKIGQNPNFRTALFFSSERSANSLPTCANGSTTLVLAMRNKLESLSNNSGSSNPANCISHLTEILYTV